jgi:hypothetical protein
MDLDIITNNPRRMVSLSNEHTPTSGGLKSPQNCNFERSLRRNIYMHAEENAVRSESGKKKVSKKVLNRLSSPRYILDRSKTPPTANKVGFLSGYYHSPHHFKLNSASYKHSRKRSNNKAKTPSSLRRQLNFSRTTMTPSQPRGQATMPSPKRRPFKKPISSAKLKSMSLDQLAALVNRQKSEIKLFQMPNDRSSERLMGKSSSIASPKRGAQPKRKNTTVDDVASAIQKTSAQRTKQVLSGEVDQKFSLQKRKNTTVDDVALECEGMERRMGSNHKSMVSEKSILDLKGTTAIQKSATQRTKQVLSDEVDQKVSLQIKTEQGVVVDGREKMMLPKEEVQMENKPAEQSLLPDSQMYTKQNSVQPGEVPIETSLEGLTETCAKGPERSGVKRCVFEGKSTVKAPKDTVEASDISQANAEIFKDITNQLDEMQERLLYTKRNVELNIARTDPNWRLGNETKSIRSKATSRLRDAAGSIRRNALKARAASLRGNSHPIVASYDPLGASILQGEGVTGTVCSISLTPKQKKKNVLNGPEFEGFACKDKENLVNASHSRILTQQNCHARKYPFGSSASICVTGILNAVSPVKTKTKAPPQKKPAVTKFVANIIKKVECSPFAERFQKPSRENANINSERRYIKKLFRFKN